MTVIVLNIVIFGFLTFVPTFFVKAGLSVVKSLSFTTIMTLGGPVGGVIAFLVVDRIGRKATLIASALIAAVGCFYPYVGNGLLITAVGFFDLRASRQSWSARSASSQNNAVSKI